MSALQLASVAWALCTTSRQMLWTSMVALDKRMRAPSSEDPALRVVSSAEMFPRVSWSLLALATTATGAAVAGVAVLPLVLDDPARQQQSFDAAFVALAVLFFLMHISAAVSYERLSAIAREQEQAHRRTLMKTSANADTISDMADLARRMRKLALIMVSIAPPTFVLLAVTGASIQSRQAVRPLPCRGSCA